jgi:hypothetical protein
MTGKKRQYFNSTKTTFIANASKHTAENDDVKLQSIMATPDIVTLTTKLKEQFIKPREDTAQYQPTTQ